MPEKTPSDETPSEKPGREGSEATPAVTTPSGEPVEQAVEAGESSDSEATPNVDETAERPVVQTVVSPVPLVPAAAELQGGESESAESENAESETGEAGTSGGGSKGRKIAALAAVGGLALLAGGYVVAHQMTTGKVPQGTSVAGVKIGGQSITDAERTLEQAFADRASDELVATVGDAEAPERITPRAAGLSFDHAETLEQAGASTSWAPTALWAYFTGGNDIDPVVEIDDSSFEKLTARLDEEHGVKVREGRVRFVDGEIATRAPRIGQKVDREQARAAFSETFVSEDRALKVEVVEDAPTIGEAQIKDALESFAEPAVSGPVTLTSGDVSLELDPAEYSSSLKMVASDGALVPELNSKKLASLIKRELAEDGGPQEATVKLVNGSPQVVPDQKGVTFDQDEVDEIFLELVAAEEGKRSAEVKSKEARSDFTVEDAKKLNIVERISSFETQYPYAEYRNVNIGRAAELIDGTVLKPGETFSLNETVGERTRENGFTTGIMIADGVFKEDLGGGVSQMATTVFNSMFFAGLEDVEHKPHSFYISRYPVGREATVAWGSVDLKFRNDSPHGVLIEAKVQKAGPGGQGVVRVSMWSTKVWDITTSTSGRYALTSPKTRTLSGPTCMPNSGYGGFNVDVKRYFAKPGSGKIEKTENFRTTYTPSDTVICE